MNNDKVKDGFAKSVSNIMSRVSSDVQSESLRAPTTVQCIKDTIKVVLTARGELLSPEEIHMGRPFS